MTSKDEKDIRKKHNDEILKRFKRGESLKSYDSFSSWFPPRPIIEKDKKALEILHKEKKVEKNTEEEVLTPPISLTDDGGNKSEKSES